MKEKFAIPAVGAIIIKRVGEEEYILVQNRAKNSTDGTDGQLEIPAGKIREYENIFEALRREVREETGLHITSIQGEEESVFLDVKGNQTIVFSPYCVTQNLSGAYSIILSTFLCEAEGELLDKTNETENIRWMKKEELKQIVDNYPERVFLMHVNALRKYFLKNPQCYFKRQNADKQVLLDNLNKLHTTELGADRIKKNLKLDIEDIVTYCKKLVLDEKSNIYKQGKNWYCQVDNVLLTINAQSYTIITAHEVKGKK